MKMTNRFQGSIGKIALYSGIVLALGGGTGCKIHTITPQPTPGISIPKSEQKARVMVQADSKYVGSLREILESGSEEIPKYAEVFDADGNFNIDLDPSLDEATSQIFYGLEVDASGQGEVIVRYDKHAGHCFILNKDGFFITNRHVIDYLLEETKEGVYRIGLVCDAKRGTISQARILAYVQEPGADIALGKIEVPEGIDYPTTRICRATPEYGDGLMVFQSLDKDRLFSTRAEVGLYAGIIDAGTFPMLTHDGKIFGVGYEQDKKFIPQEELEVGVKMAPVIEASGADINQEQSFSLLCGPELGKGDSGNPVLLPNGDLAGLVERLSEKGEFVAVYGQDGQDTADQQVVIAVKPSAIREFLSDYLGACEKLRPDYPK